jgi:hypothetical protein
VQFVHVQAEAEGRASMSLWLCPTHGLYGGDVFCPKCGGTGGYVTFSPLERAKASHRPLRDVDEIVGITERTPAQVGRSGEAIETATQIAGSTEGEHAVGEADAPKGEPS